MAITIENVAKYFDRYGWSYQLLEGEPTILSGFKGDEGYFKIETHLHKGWLTFSLMDFLPKIPDEKLPEICRYALELNTKMSYCRFVLMEGNLLTIVADIPAQTRLDYDLFAMGLDLVSFFADQAYPKFAERLGLEETSEDQGSKS
jgi:hypothetical protein